jgi:hypothetical protein
MCVQSCLMFSPNQTDSFRCVFSSMGFQREFSCFFLNFVVKISIVKETINQTDLYIYMYINIRIYIYINSLLRDSVYLLFRIFGLQCGVGGNPVPTQTVGPQGPSTANVFIYPSRQRYTLSAPDILAGFLWRWVHRPYIHTRYIYMDHLFIHTQLHTYIPLLTAGAFLWLSNTVQNVTFLPVWWGGLDRYV